MTTHHLAQADPHGPTTPAATPAGQPPPDPPPLPALSALAVPVICFAQLMATLDVTIVNLALPSMQRDLALAAADLAWVVDAYTLGYAGLLLVGGRAGDLFGRRRVLLAGIALFTTASLVAGLAEAAPLLLAARAAQGLGAALATPTTLSMITTLIPPGPARTRAMVAYGAMAGLGITLGLALGGALAEAASWRWVFWVNVPIGALVLAAALRVLPESRGPRRRLDLAGAAVGTTALTCLAFGVIRGGEHGWSDPSARLALVAAVLALALFARIESTVPEPTLPLGLLRHPVRAGAYAVAGLLFACLYPAFLMLSRVLQQVQGHGPLAAGLRFLPIGAGVLVLAVVARRLMTRTGPPALIVGGTLATAAGTGGLMTLDAQDGYPVLLLALIGLGAGVGTTFVANSALSMTGVRDADAGVASGLLSTVQAIGGTLGVAALVSTAAAASADALRADPYLAPEQALMTGFQQGFAWTAAIAAAAVACGAFATVASRRSGGAR